MPADIRNFFGGGSLSSQENPSQKTSSKEPALESKSKGRGKRKVLSDSDDDDVAVKPTLPATPAKARPKKQARQDSPKGEATTTSDYFAASGKSKPSRSTPHRPKPKRQSEPSQKPAEVQQNATPKQDAPLKNGRSSARKKRPNYAESASDELNEDGFNDTKGKNESDSGEDVFEADFKAGSRGGKDAYEPETDEDQILNPTRKPGRPVKRSSPSPAKKVQDGASTKAGQTGGIVARTAKKRKSEDLEDSDDQDNNNSAKKKTKTAQVKTPVKKSTPKKKTKKEPPSRTAVDDILEDIPTIKAPSPPPRDDSKKFDWRTAQARPEPIASGAKAEIPQGADNCLAGLSFVFTGVLQGLDRNDGQELVKRFGGKVTGAPSSKTSYVVLGTDAGPKKLETIKQHGIKTIDETGLFELIKRLPANGGDSKAAEQFEAKRKKEQDDIKKAAEEMAAKEQQEERKSKKTAATSSRSTQNAGAGDEPAKDTRLWTVKYAPNAVSMVCGNKGQVEKLQNWLRAWPGNSKTGFKKPGKDGSGIWRAIILHGPPGVGKTTAAHLAAKLEGYDIVESNASDTRSKKLVETGLKGVLDTTSLMGYFAGDGKQIEETRKKLCLIMDEVDGMSAGDRGGVGAMAATCRKTHIPIILICNDKKLPKMRPFDTVAYDLPFRKPTVDQVRQRMMTICYREKLSIPAPVINALIEGSNADIRQVINMLSTAKIDQQAMDFDQGKKMSKSWEKNAILRPWDIVSKILGGGMFASSSNATLNDKIELYFNDHEFSGLMLQENYLGTRPIGANQYSGKEHHLKVLELTEKAAASISDGDLVDRMIHGSQQQWSLMPTHAVFSFVRPASFVAGTQAGHQTRFTSWLGNNSKTGKYSVWLAMLPRLIHVAGKLARFVKEIQGHMRLRSTGDRHEVRQQYFSLLWYRLIKQLQKSGADIVPDIIDLMDSYYLTKDDWDAFLELGVGPMDMENIKIDTQAKSAFTRTYNKQSHPLPFMKASQVVAPKKKDKEQPDLEEAMEESDSGAESGADKPELSDDEPLDLKKDRYVKAPKKKAAATTTKSKGAGKGKEKDKQSKKEDKKVKEEADDDDDEEDFDVKPKKGRGKASARKGGSTKAR